MNIAARSVREATLSVTYSRDLLGRMIAVGAPGDPKRYAEYVYTATGNITEETLKSPGRQSITRSRTYDSMGHLRSISDPVFTQSLAYEDESGAYQDGHVVTDKVSFQREKFESPPRNVAYRYGYDHFGRLISALATDGDTHDQISGGTVIPQIIDHDETIRRMQVGDLVQTYSFAPGTHQVTAVTDQTGDVRRMAHSAGGAVTSVKGLDLEIDYDLAHSKPSMIDLVDSSGHVELQYNDEHRVLRCKTVGQTTSKRLYFGGEAHTMAEFESSGGAAVATRYIRGPTGVIGIDLDGDYYRPLVDYLGSLRAVVDGDAKPVAWFNYRPFGTFFPNNSGGDPNLTQRFRYLYTGHEYEADLGLYNMRARLYDPQIATFLDVDPAIEAPNAYAYALNNPIAFVDPTGTSCFGRAFVPLHPAVRGVQAAAGHLTANLDFEANAIYTTIGRWRNVDVSIRGSTTAFDYMSADKYVRDVAEAYAVQRAIGGGHGMAVPQFEDVATAFVKLKGQTDWRGLGFLDNLWLISKAGFGASSMGWSFSMRAAKWAIRSVYIVGIGGAYAAKSRANGNSKAEAAAAFFATAISTFAATFAPDLAYQKFSRLRIAEAWPAPRAGAGGVVPAADGLTTFTIHRRLVGAFIPLGGGSLFSSATGWGARFGQTFISNWWWPYGFAGIGDSVTKAATMWGLVDDKSDRVKLRRRIAVGAAAGGLGLAASGILNGVRAGIKGNAGWTTKALGPAGAGVGYLVSGTNAAAGWRNKILLKLGAELLGIGVKATLDVLALQGKFKKWHA